MYVVLVIWTRLEPEKCACAACSKGVEITLTKHVYRPKQVTFAPRTLYIHQTNQYYLKAEPEEKVRLWTISQPPARVGIHRAFQKGLSTMPKVLITRHIIVWKHAQQIEVPPETALPASSLVKYLSGSVIICTELSPETALPASTLSRCHSVPEV